MEEGISLCMIVKNEEKNLERCLNSVKNLVQEMIIVDTGSEDETKKIAKNFTDKIYDFTWTNDFSEARNFSISKANHEWILILDADESISGADCDKTIELIKNKEKNAFLLTCRNYTNETGIAGWKSSKDDIYEESKCAAGYYEAKVLRLFRNGKDYHFQGKIHETPHKTIEDKRDTITNSSVVMHHFGALDEKKFPEKKEKYIDMLKQRLDDKDFQEKTEDYICFELSRELINLKRYEEAIRYSRRAVEIEEKFIYLLGLGGLYLATNQLEEAEKILKRAVVLEPGNYSVHDNLGVVYAKRGEYNKAIRKFERAIELNPKSADVHFNLALVYKNKGKNNKMKEFLLKAVELNPKYKERVNFG